MAMEHPTPKIQHPVTMLIFFPPSPPKKKRHFYHRYFPTKKKMPILVIPKQQPIGENREPTWQAILISIEGPAIGSAFAVSPLALGEGRLQPRRQQLLAVGCQLL
jgi:hypothetical protein